MYNKNKRSVMFLNLGNSISRNHDVEIENQVKSLLEGTRFVAFIREHRMLDNMEVIKVIDAWEQNEIGDLKAIYTKNSSTPFVCPGDKRYKIKAITEEEIKQLGLDKVL
jgi:hypothetical protein